MNGKKTHTHIIFSNMDSRKSKYSGVAKASLVREYMCVVTDHFFFAKCFIPIKYDTSILLFTALKRARTNPMKCNIQLKLMSIL